MDDPFAFVVIPGVLGGVLFAVWLFRANRRSPSNSSADAAAPDRLSIDMINMAHIRVAGVGGLGLVVMALLIALYVPRIGQTLALGSVLGAIMAVVLILKRRRRGPMTSSGQRSGANTTLAIDGAEEETVDRDEHNGTEVFVAAANPATR